LEEFVMLKIVRRIVEIIRIGTALLHFAIALFIFCIAYWFWDLGRSFGEEKQAILVAAFFACFGVASIQKGCEQFLQNRAGRPNPPAHPHGLIPRGPVSRERQEKDRRAPS
jgi:hypothetical protein